MNAGGKILRVSDVAEVTRGYIDPATFVIHHEGEPALILGVVMRRNFNGLTLGETLEAEEAAIQAELPVGIAFSKVSYQATIIEEAIHEFARLNSSPPSRWSWLSAYSPWVSGWEWWRWPCRRRLPRFSSSCR